MNSSTFKGRGDNTVTECSVHLSIRGVPAVLLPGHLLCRCSLAESQTWIELTRARQAR